MYVRYLSLIDFRSWTAIDLSLQPGINVLIGENGAGKTNLAEALGYLATLSSHRVAGEAPLIRRGAEQALVRAAVVSAGRELLLEVEISAGRANRARINRSPLTRARDLLGALRTVLFAPEDLVLVRGDPGERRRFLDEVMVMRVPRLAGARADYERVLKQRVALLKSAGALRRGRSAGRSGGSGRVDPNRVGADIPGSDTAESGTDGSGIPGSGTAGSDPAGSGVAGSDARDSDRGGGGPLSTLDVWDEHLARTGAALVVARLELVELIRPHVIAAYAALAPTSEPADIAYRSSLGDAAPAGPIASAGPIAPGGPTDLAGLIAADPTDPAGASAPASPTAPASSSAAREDEWAAALRAEMTRLRPQELERGVCLVGPHRDDLEIRLGDGPAKGYASHGESWSLALALRLGAFALLRSDGVDPVLILDDVFAELDTDRRDRLAALVAPADQVLVTAAVPGDVPAGFAGRRFRVTRDAVEEER